MRGRVIPLLLCSLFLSTTAFPQCDYQALYSAPLRSTYFDIALEGNEIWAATGYGVQLLDGLSSPPRVLALVAVPDVTRTIEIRGGVIYAGSGTSVHVLRRIPTGLEIVRSIETGAQVNDLAASAGSLFVATSNGLLAFNRQDAMNPTAPVTLSTSSPDVLSLARNGESQLYAADGDSSVERFSIAGTPAPSGALSALPRSVSVNIAGGRIFVSDFHQTRIFTIDGTATATMPYGVSTAIGHSGDVFFVAGSDRRFRALDLTLQEQPVELYAADIIPTGGTVNRIGAMAAAGGRLYVAGGDAGLLTIDTASFVDPFPLRSHAFGMKTSVAESATAVFVSDVFGGLTELTRFSSGRLGVRRTWATSQTHVVHALSENFLLTSSGPTVSYWTVGSATPAAISTGAMAAPVRAAALNGSTALVLLADRTLWTLDLSREQPTPVRIDVAPADFIGRTQHGAALVNITDEGSTQIRFHAGGNFAAAPLTTTVEGAATTFAMSDSRVAVFTFRGITLVDFSSGAPQQTLLPQSATGIVRDLELQGNRLLDLTSTTLRVWDIEQRRAIHTFTLPAEAHSLSTHPTAATATVLTSDGVASIDYESSARQPRRLATLSGNQYATKIVTSARRIFLLDRSTVSVYDTAAGAAPRYTASVGAAGAIDLAASEDRLFILFGNGTVTSYNHNGGIDASTKIDEGADAVPLAIFTAGGAPWVSFSRGCLSTGCEEKTIVLDPVSLVRTATLEGGMKDVAAFGGFAYARVDVPPQKLIRAYDLAQPFHPVLTASQQVDPSVVAVAANAAGPLALGTRLFRHAPGSLVQVAEELAPVAVSTSTDIAVDGNCAVVTGRSPAAEFFAWSGTQWTPAGGIALPGVARGISVQPGRLVILTDYSTEILSRVASPTPPRRRSAR